MLLAVTQHVLFLSRAFAHPQPPDPFRISPGQMVALCGPHARDACHPHDHEYESVEFAHHEVTVVADEKAGDGPE